jgi:hypothetical protein
MGQIRITIRGLLLKLDGLAGLLLALCDEAFEGFKPGVALAT